MAVRDLSNPPVASPVSSPTAPVSAPQTTSGELGTLPMRRKRQTPAQARSDKGATAKLGMMRQAQSTDRDNSYSY